jgi:excisionase family DNA binding protein
LNSFRAKPFTTGEVARYCGVTPVTVFNWIQAGKLKSFKTGGGHNRVLPIELRSFLEKNFINVPNELQKKDEISNILVVDDDAMILDLIEEHLLKLNPRPRSILANNGFEACIRLGEHHIDLIILDLLMPGMDGLELCSSLSKISKTRNIPVIIVSGYLDDQTKKKLTALGITDFLEKPFRMKDLLDKTSKLLQQ